MKAYKTGLHSFFFMLTVIILTGCQGFETPAADADFGNPPVNYEAAIKNVMNRILRDPESARYSFNKPVKAYRNIGLAYGGKIKWIGWVVDVEVNAKNGFGGYAGATPYTFYFDGENIKSFKPYYDNNVLLHRM